MEFFIDTANIAEITAAHSLGIISGVTTNPSLIAREGRSFLQVVKEITDIVDGPISAEVISLESDGMIAEARELVKIHRNIIIKIPMCAAGLRATHILAAEGIKVNMTLIFSANQGLLAAKAGAAYVSPFIGRLDDIGQDGMTIIADLVKIFNNYQLPAKIIAASIRHPIHVTQAALHGAHIATVPYKIILQMVDHPLTDAGIKKFLADWQTVEADS